MEAIVTVSPQARYVHCRILQVTCFITMLCSWGSGSNSSKFVSKEWRFQLYDQDHAIGVFLLALLLAFTPGATVRRAGVFWRTFGKRTATGWGADFLGGVILGRSKILVVAHSDCGPGGGVSRGRGSRWCWGDYYLPFDRVGNVPDAWRFGGGRHGGDRPRRARL